jgi:hypothetical protein
MLAFFGMELGGEHVALPDGGGEGVTVGRARGDDALILRLREKAVDEIDVAAVRNAFVERTVGLGDVDLVPADLGHLQSITLLETHYFPFEDAEAGCATVELRAALEEGLIADADAEKWSIRCGPFAHGGQHVLPAHCVQAVIESTNAGEHEAARAVDAFGCFGHTDIGSDFEQGLFHAPQIAGTVIEQSNHAGN